MIAQTWSYGFQYPDGSVDDKLHIPAGVPVEMLLESKDVIHGFYVPEFRVKKDIVPGRYNRLWFQCNIPDVYDIYCTQYCGQGHSKMRSKCTVESLAEFNNYLDRLSHPVGPPADLGRHLYETRGCMGCHTIDGSKGTGPTWKNMWGNNVDFESGPSLIVNAALRPRVDPSPSRQDRQGISQCDAQLPGAVEGLANRRHHCVHANLERQI